MDENVAKRRLLIYSLVRFAGFAVFLFGVAVIYSDLLRPGGWPQVGAIIAIMFQQPDELRNPASVRRLRLPHLRQLGLGLGFGLGWRWRRGRRLRPRLSFRSRPWRDLTVRLAVVRGLPLGLFLARQHCDIEGRAPVFRPEIAEIMLDIVRTAIRALGIHPEDCFPARVGQPDLAKTPLARRSHARADKLQAAVPRALGQLVEPRVAHSRSITWRIRPTRPPTSVPLMRMY